MRVDLPHDMLMAVSRPARYTGGERNSVTKNHDDVRCAVALAFPDAYEVGMSHLGIQLLYQELNRRQDTAAERVFAPWHDMEQEMRTRGIPLFSLESRRPVAEFDVLGFSLQYELLYTNVLLMLDLAGIPRYARDRTSEVLVCAGGVGSFNPEPVAELFDFVVVGDGEEVIHEIVDVIIDSKEINSRDKRNLVLQRLAQLHGVYVPSGYEVSYCDDGTISDIRARSGFPVRIKKRIVADLDSVRLPDEPIVPLIEVVHDRSAVELARGCSRGCRFCQAGYIGRPIREKSKETVTALGRALLETTGVEELSLLSLSSSDYSFIREVCEELGRSAADKRVNLSLPSLRVDAFTIELARWLHVVRKSGLTFAPEAGSERLRRVINKDITDQDMLDTADAAWKAGWDRLKLYFMIGLPTETEDDIEAICALVDELRAKHRQGKKAGDYAGRPLKLAVSVVPFVPKPHTPFQWVAQSGDAELRERLGYLRNRLRGKWVEVSVTDPEISRVEAVLARGDRRVLAAVERAYELGARFDAWMESWNADIWRTAFVDAGVDPGFYAGRHRDVSEVLPWHHIDAGVSNEFLAREFTKAFAQEHTDNCRVSCAGCGVLRYGVCGEKE